MSVDWSVGKDKNIGNPGTYLTAGQIALGIPFVE